VADIRPESPADFVGMRTVEQLLQLGTRRVVYLKAGTHDGELGPFALYGADGAFLTAFDTFEEAVEMVAANDLNFVAIH
jgi:hypothetical protein